MSSTVLPKFVYVIDHKIYSVSGASLVKNTCPWIGPGFFSNFKGPYSCRAIHKDVYPWETLHVLGSCEGLKPDPVEEPNVTEKMKVDSYQHILGGVDTTDDREIERRKKIGHRNKGKVPWNKGRKHSEGNYFALKFPLVKTYLSKVLSGLILCADACRDS